MDPEHGASEGGTPGVVARLRQLISADHYRAGERLGEVAVAQTLGVSRTPVRLAFRTLAQEGLLQVAGKRGYVVRDFSAADVLIAVEVRGVLEGLAARRLAETGLGVELSQTLGECIAEGDDVLRAGRLDEDTIGRWSRLNVRFHDAIVNAGPSRVVANAIARNNHLPFASADSITVRKDALPSEYRKLLLAQMQHRLVFQALNAGESARAEALMREHAYIGVRYAELLGAPPESFAAKALSAAPKATLTGWKTSAAQPPT